MLYILDIIEDTIVDGTGLRTSIYGAGCPHACPGCHNPQSWHKKNGNPVDTGTIMEVINRNPVANVTFSGGEPFSQTEGFIELAKRIKSETNKTIWCYTGYRYESLMLHPKHKELLSYIDVLVDGPFIQELKDETLRFRGSSNQRIVYIKDFFVFETAL
ncbi:MAG: anaerobic ribonucleoside-triphosphate reductase activating protein [Dysgonamonadaceae bacterium]|jgi:anaerobic ribonucleoside-triphosphate reductase activating protein|nr:anaerobic ribonucleoside-triphosphate reductase activating protein [Dysgonamonadaceae bacterium]